MDADYLINMAILKRHDYQTAVTLCAKNHFGSIGEPSALHGLVRYWERGSSSQGLYDPLVDLMGHQNIGGKTLLYIMNGLYGSMGAIDPPRRWRLAPFQYDWPASVFMSQDPVAIDSVCLDFLNVETVLRDRADNYLHEAALAHDPPSGTEYDPEGDGTALASLGVHEHWNNPTDKQYSRNLGTGEGIELVTPAHTDPNGPVENQTTGLRYTRIRYAIQEAQDGDILIVSPGLYRETIRFTGKAITLRSFDPNDSSITAATLVSSDSQVIVFDQEEGPDSVLAGITITGGQIGIQCSAANPTITHCRILQNSVTGIDLSQESAPRIAHCIIAANGGPGMAMHSFSSGRRETKYNKPEIVNCTIVQNEGPGILGGMSTLQNSIVQLSGSETTKQIDSQPTSVNYCNISGTWSGVGNFDSDPGPSRSWENPFGPFGSGSMAPLSTQ